MMLGLTADDNAIELGCEVRKSKLKAILMRVIPPIKAVIYFEAAARLQSFKLAAEELCVTPGAVSHQINTLEDFIGQKLFLRQNRAIKLTNCGLRYYERTFSILNDLEVATADLGRHTKNAQLKIAIPPTLLNKWLLPKLDFSKIEQQGIEVTFVDTLDHLDFAKDNIDIAIRYGFELPEGFHSDHLFTEEMIVVCAPDYMAKPYDDLSSEFLSSSTLIYTTNRLVQWDVLLHHYKLKPSQNQSKLIFQNSIHAIDAAVLGLGVAFVNRILVDDIIKTGKLIEAFKIDIQTEKVPSYFLVARHENMQHDHVKYIYDYLKKLATD
ncbi:LysR substrate-binding domain-containing protein [Photobacterium nomapromontoriensis]|uniref:LysR substrate-binding domain-containing protein n=1 Tax=Photobacterium nomapromontoriensis TaxID=2910237 RepID=UPI003D0C83A7